MPVYDDAASDRDLIFQGAAVGGVGIAKPGHTLAEQAYAKLKRDIVGCRHRPGSLINEGELAALYGMSKTPIREALSLLEREGFIQVLPRRGTLVKTIELEDIQNTFLLRMLIEPESAALAASRGTTQQLKVISETSDAVGTKRRSNAGAEQLTAHRLFHEAIAEASGIREMVTLVRSLHDKVEWFYNYERVPTAHSSGDNNGDLASAICAGDADRARSLAAESIRLARQHLIDVLIREPQLSAVVGAQTAIA